MTDAACHGAYGQLPESLISLHSETVQFSPLIPGAAALEACMPASLDSFVMLAPPGTLERRYAIAQALRALAPGAPFHILAPKERGGARLVAELRALGCLVADVAKRHHRICSGTRPPTLTALEDTLAETGPRRVPPFDLWTQPGVFSWDRLDPGSALLMTHLPALSGHGADFGCGTGTLSRGVLTSPAVKSLLLIDIDRRAIEAARRNVEDPRVTFRWSDLQRPDNTLAKLDFVVMNPPFHEGGTEERSLGRTFIQRASESLRRGGRLWLTANRHLPYEGVIRTLFRTVTVAAEAGGYKIFEAVL
ncbi:class I SAM-dependent methyltransferase [Lichenifustis flavocetrariae]|uniref:Class I SAM-dependent methyltransferase n=1 Tax=Lichenifustis flavocetrariae TaxID=2949735 RepID=A0AA41Z099_9HYPH|nr:class I SAM-dependent methyltransferase [Lichenifustis flavocetrariae]MCW6508168.1 class I SAM-dependent methyltransferase [Lichenifustis flavocetrariae]